ncbi:penicillin-binding protein activator [Pukyongiella litopenaei]|uniref:Penicillin-binding protein activator n=1 Tax=Pukyongiella litopenaei TaxID=2605946 RepID=A0A2S0MQF3_9RHOB|nr:penicillin-binding protein activator [Pukyongiella litopenaei]AVO38112.1 penicillin-binding protein activator [Pukyongiella litopenaei]
MFAVFKSRRKVVLAVAALASAAFLSACDVGIGGGGGGPRIDTSKPVPVALLVPRGSAQAGDSAIASNLENAARMAIADLQGVQIDLRVYDTAGNAATAASAATQAANDGAQIILGPVYGQAANAAGLAVKGRNINVLAFSNNPTIAGGNVFVLGNTFENTAQRLTSFAARNGKRNLLVVHGTDVAGLAGLEAIRRGVGGTGAKIVGTVPYDLSQQAVIAAVPRVRDAASTSGADAVFLTSTTAGALPLFAQMLPEAGVSPAITQYIGLTRWDIPSQTLALPGVQGGWFALPDPGMTQRFQARYSSVYGAAPHPIAGLGYDGIAAIGALVKAGKANALTGAALTQGAGFQGVNGIFRLRRDGTNQRGMAVATIRNQQVVVIDPAPASFSGAGF